MVLSISLNPLRVCYNVYFFLLHVEKLRHSVANKFPEKKKKKKKSGLGSRTAWLCNACFFAMNFSLHYIKEHIGDLSQCLTNGGINKTINKWAIINRSPSQMLNLLVCAFYGSFGAFSVEEKFTFSHHLQLLWCVLHQCYRVEMMSSLYLALWTFSSRGQA